MMLCLPPCWFYCKVISLPDFEPNEYLFEQHPDKGESRWEIFAWAVRDIMMKQGDLGDNHMTWKNKDNYEKYMQMAKGAKIPEFAPGGVPIEAPKPEATNLNFDPESSQTTEEDDLKRKLIPSIKQTADK